MAVYTWSQTAGSNATADPSINYAEGQAPSTLNDSARALMAAIAKFRDDISGSITTAGTSTAYTVTSNSTFDTLAHLNGQMIAVVPHTTNGATVTLNVDSLGAKPWRIAPNVEIQSGTLVQGTPYIAVYNNSDGAFYLQGSSNSAYAIPLGGSLDYWGTAAPNSAFAFPYGQAISRTTYATLFSLMGTTYGTGDGSTTFNIPDVRGRIVLGKDDMGGVAANRITSGGSGITGTTLGAVGGAQSATLGTSNLPPYTPAGSVSVTSTVGNVVQSPSIANPTLQGGATSQFTLASGSSVSAISSTGSLSGTAQGGTSAPFGIVPPAIVCNRILRII